MGPKLLESFRELDEYRFISHAKRSSLEVDIICNTLVKEGQPLTLTFGNAKPMLRFNRFASIDNFANQRIIY